MMDAFGDEILGDWPLTKKTTRWAIVAVVLLYIVLFPLMFPILDHTYFVLGLVPVVLVGLLRGLRPAILTVIVVMIANLGILLGPLGTPLEDAIVESFPGVTLLIGVTVGYLRDMRQELARQRDELEDRNERLDKFASIVSHDLRNPLNVAMGRLELARDDCDSDHLDSVARSHTRMEALITDMLTLAKEGKSVAETEAIDLEKLTERCWGNVETSEATLVASTDSVIQADSSRLQQLLENLMRNAVEHGGDSVTITVGDLDDGFYILDDGRGFQEGAQDRVFDMGYSSAESGTGFGLSIVEEIAEAHGWNVRVTESSGGGARFEIMGVKNR